MTFTAPQTAQLLPAQRQAEPLGADEVEGRTLASLVSAGTELAWGYTGTDFPALTGYAAVFEIERVGEAVSGLKSGDVVFTMGPHRSFQRARECDCVPVPNGLAPQAATFCRMMGISMTTLATTAARPPSGVLVTGLGPVGHMAARVFDVCGYRVTGCDPSPARREMLTRFGIDAVAAATDAGAHGKYALAVECSGHERAVLDGALAVRKGGEVSLIGVPWRRKSDVYAFDLLHAIFHRYVHVRSGWEWEVPVHEQEFRPGSLLGNFAAALGWLATGRVAVDGLWAGRRPDDCGAVYADLLAGKTEKLVEVFEW